MVARPPALARVDNAEEDERVVLHGKTWDDFARIVADRGEAPRPRIYYLDGEIELLSPGYGHEVTKTGLARLLELWSIEVDVPLDGIGSWLLKRSARAAGAEPDECYTLGPSRGRRKPDLAIEVAWSRGGLSKLDIYARLGVGEVWMVHRDARVEVFVLRRGKYARVLKSELLPMLDLPWLVAFLTTNPTHHEACRALRDALRRSRRGSSRQRK
jgi:Uma2 family endonuclease